jgi:adenine-specific DNA-methyltransferase
MNKAKLPLHTLDLTNKNYAALAALFPNAVTETTDENGTVVRAIDADILAQEINTHVVSGKEERYQFTWPDKKKSVLLANSPISATLRPCREESVNFDNTENIYIEGDNLDVLKLLRETYLNRVKVIYIDPPYNTGNDFIYNDKWKMVNNEWREKSGDYDEENNRMVLNLDSNGLFHTNWLNMMYPRIKTARDLLTDDGVIFISIDDNEYGNTIKLFNELFSENNYIGTLILQTATDNNPRQICTEHEYVISYAKNKNNLPYWQTDNDKVKLIQAQYSLLKQKYDNSIEIIQKELRAWIKKNASSLEGVTHYDNVDEKGVFHDGDIANTIFGGYKYTIIHPKTGKPCKIPEKGFRFTESTMREMIEKNDIMFGIDETTLIKPKKRIENTKDALRSIIYEDGRISTKKFEQLMARDIFQNPKSDTVLTRLFKFVVNDNDIVMDFFSGAATTAESVINLNSKQNTNVKFILIQLAENLDESLIKSDLRTNKTIQNAIKFLDLIDKPHKITEIGKERIRRAGQKIIEESPPDRADLDIGFRVLKLDSSNMKDVYYTPQETVSAGGALEVDLDGFVDNIKPDRTPEDLLFQVMLDLGILLSSKIEKRETGGKTVFSVADNYLLACFDLVTDEIVTEIAKSKPYYAVFRDSSFYNDATLVNFEQIFKTHSPSTIRKVL